VAGHPDDKIFNYPRASIVDQYGANSALAFSYSIQRCASFLAYQYLTG